MLKKNYKHANKHEKLSTNKVNISTRNIEDKRKTKIPEDIEQRKRGGGMAAPA